MNKPQIRIKNAWLVYENISVHLDELWGNKDEPLSTYEEMDNRVAAFRKVWEVYEERIIDGMYGLTGQEFHKNIIDVHIAPWVHPMSDPIIIHPDMSPDEFVDTLTHELVHELLTDNKIFSVYDHPLALGNAWMDMFGKEHTFNALIHIPVHAVSKAIYLDVLNDPARLKRDINSNQEAPDYKAAWDYVEKNDYKNIITDVKKFYMKDARL